MLGMAGGSRKLTKSDTIVCLELGAGKLTSMGAHSMENNGDTPGATPRSWNKLSEVLCQHEKLERMRKRVNERLLLNHVGLMGRSGTTNMPPPVHGGSGPRGSMAAALCLHRR